VNSIDFDRLLERSKTERVTPAEPRVVAEALKDPSSTADRYTLLHILGRSGDLHFEDLVRGFLSCPSDPLLSRLVLQVLCSFWGRTVDYLDYVKAYLSGVEWDIDEEVRQIAISITGEYLVGHDDQDLLGKLLEIAGSAAERPLIREDAIRALARGLGYAWTEIPPASTQIPIDGPWASEVLLRAYERFTRA
jgi:hypothetical protein